MKKDKRIVVANWKMHPGSAAEARLLFSKTKRAGSRLERVETLICPPFCYLGLFPHAGTTRVTLGAQSSFWLNSASATGEVSPEMLRDLGVSYVIIGHSERRKLGETDEVVAKKLRGVLGEGLIPILCVGEKERDADGAYFEILRGQLKASLAEVRKTDLSGLIIAYEPLWAIGKSAKDACMPRDIHETVIFIRKVLTDIYDAASAAEPKILYGGSVEAKNAAAILTEGTVTGLLVGHASLDAEEFTSLLKAANAA